MKKKWLSMKVFNQSYRKTAVNWLTIIKEPYCAEIFCKDKFQIT